MNKFYLSVKEGVPAKGYWDMHLLDLLLNDFADVSDLKYVDEAVVLIAGAYQFDVVDKINKELSRLRKCIVIITSDEENKFPIEQLDHPHMVVYSTYPNGKAKPLPIGHTPHSASLKWVEKDLDVFYSGQVNHQDRKEMIEELEWFEGNKYINTTDGFSQGLDHNTYMDFMSRAKVVPSPKGNISYDSFRMYEALEAGAIPVGQSPEFYTDMFKDYPFPVISNKEQWRGYITDALTAYEKLSVECMAWWARTKYKIRQEFIEFFNTRHTLSFIVPVSPIPSHPDIYVLAETYKSIRHHFPYAPIYFTFDGVREEQKHLKSAYYEHIKHFLFELREDVNIYPIVFDKHEHQVGMAREVMEIIKTPFVCYIEQDCPLVTDAPIEWEKIINFIDSGESNVVRFHYDSVIPKEHERLMMGMDNGFMRTMQWSQRPAVYSSAYFKRILADYFTKKANCFIEDGMHKVVYKDCWLGGIMGWYQHRIHIYHPQGSIKRSVHLDGRSGTKKFDDKQVF